MAFDVGTLEQNPQMWEWLTKLVNQMSSNQTEGLNPQITSGKGSVDWLKYFAGLKQGNWQTMLNWLGQYLVGQNNTGQKNAGQPSTNFLNLGELNKPVMGGLQSSKANEWANQWEQAKQVQDWDAQMKRLWSSEGWNNSWNQNPSTPVNPFFSSPQWQESWNNWNSQQ